MLWPGEETRLVRRRKTMVWAISSGVAPRWRASFPAGRPWLLRCRRCPVSIAVSTGPRHGVDARQPPPLPGGALGQAIDGVLGHVHRGAGHADRPAMDDRLMMGPFPASPGSDASGSAARAQHVGVEGSGSWRRPARRWGRLRLRRPRCSRRRQGGQSCSTVWLTSDRTWASSVTSASRNSAPAPRARNSV